MSENVPARSRFDAWAVNADLRPVFYGAPLLYLFLFAIIRVPFAWSRAFVAALLPVLALLVPICRSRIRYQRGYRLQFNEKDKRLASLVEGCESLTTKPHNPPWWWCLDMGGNIQTLLSAIYKFGIVRATKRTYKRELVQISDGTTIGLDWADEDLEGAPEEGASSTKPILVLLSGLFGNSQGSHVRHLIHRIRATTGKEWRVCVYVLSGMQGVPLTTCKMWSVASTLEFTELVDHLQSRYPRAPLLAAGLSLGASLIGKYMGEQGPKCPLAGAVLMSPVWNINWKGSSFGFWDLTAICLSCKGHVWKHEKKYGEDGLVDIKKVLETTFRIRDFDTMMVLPRHPQYSSVEEMWEDTALTHVAHRIATPTLALNSTDDPIADVAALKQVKGYNGVVCMITNSGGHSGYMEASDPLNSKTYAGSYTDRVVVDWLVQCLAAHRKER